MPSKRTFLREILPLLILVIISLVIAWLTLKDYGESWDEENFLIYGRESLNAYSHIADPGFKLEYQDPSLRFYGVWFFMLLVLAGKAFPGALVSDVAHFLTFIVFQGGIILFYMLAKRWFKPLVAFAITLLFATQPLLWGHAFINDRDIPFMVAFTGAIYFGLRMIDVLQPLGTQKTKPGDGSAPSTLRSEYSRLGRSLRIILPLVLLVGFALAGWLVLSLANHWLVASSNSSTWADVRQLDMYLRKVLAYFWSILLFTGLCGAWSALVLLPFLPGMRKSLWQTELRPALRMLNRIVLNRNFIFAVFFLALATATRILGMAAGGIIFLFLLWKQGRQMLLPGVTYLVLSLPLVFLTWPYLWRTPLLNFLLAVRVMLRYPWPGQVLFNGNLYAGNELPRVYLLKLLGLQLSEPVIALLLLAVIIVAWQLLKKQSRMELLVLVGCWFGLPVLAAVIGRPFLYDNFRQLLFILPPLFLLAGIALEWVTHRQAVIVQFLLVGILALPGALSAVALHPYEYVYYNAFTGGLQGAERRYELDYWGTSLRAMAEYADQTLPLDQSVVVWGPSTSFWRYARPDLRVYDARDPRRPEHNYYAVILHRALTEQVTLVDLPELYSIKVQGVPLATLKHVGQ